MATPENMTPKYSKEDLKALKLRQADPKINRYICIEDESVLEVTEDGLCCLECEYTLRVVPREAYYVKNKTTGKLELKTRYADNKKAMKKASIVSK